MRIDGCEYDTQYTQFGGRRFGVSRNSSYSMWLTFSFVLLGFYFFLALIFFRNNFFLNAENRLKNVRTQAYV